jgi:hypothetical protein
LVLRAEAPPLQDTSPGANREDLTWYSACNEAVEMPPPPLAAPFARVRARRPLWLAALLGAGLGGCVASAYTPGTLVDAGAGQTFQNARTIGDCLDLASWTLAPAEVGPRVVVDVSFGNRCDRGIPVDLGALRVTARCGDRGGVELSPYDPRREIGPGRLAPHGAGRERIAFGAPACNLVPTGVCVDVSGITPGARRSGSAGLLDRSTPAREDATTICFADAQAGGAP